MAAGRPRKIDENVQGIGQAMTAEEMAAAEERVAGLKSPLREEEFSLPKAKVVTLENGLEIAKVGNFRASPQIGDSQTLNRFAKIEREDDEGWIEMTPDKALEYQSMGILKGYDHDKQLGLLRKPGRVKK